MKHMAEETRIITKQTITALDRTNETKTNKIYDVGFEFLQSWFRQKVHQL